MVHQYCLFFVVKTFKIYSLNNFEVYGAVLLIIVTMLYIRSHELTCLINGSLYSLTNISPFSPPPAPGDHHSIMFLWVWLFQIPHIIYLVFVFLCLTFSFNNALKIYTILPQMAEFPLYTYVCVCVNVITQLCLTLCDPMGCSPPGSTVHGILQARILEWVDIPFSRGSSLLGNWTWISPGLLHCMQILYHLSHQGIVFHCVCVCHIFFIYCSSQLLLVELPWTWECRYLFVILILCPSYIPRSGIWII